MIKIYRIKKHHNKEKNIVIEKKKNKFMKKVNLYYKYIDIVHKI